ncbi:MAG: DUF2971 domain-containing protein [Rhizobiaceae bacterium]
MDANHFRLLSILNPYAVRQYQRVVSDRIRFVHYSSAEAAMKMIGNGEVWMRRASLMNDFREVDYGIECLSSAYRSQHGDRFKKMVDDHFPGIRQEVEQLINDWSPMLADETFITCMSEHDDREDEIGRLSMWRAYGGRTGVAIVLNPTPFFSTTDALKAYSSPVAYFTKGEFVQHFEELVACMNREMPFLKTCGQETVRGYLFNAFKLSLLCTKHPGFREEREWRVYYSPKISRSSVISEDLVSLSGLPQHVQKIPLRNIPQEGLLGIDPKELIDRVIVGPTEFPFALKEVFVDLLQGKGVADPRSRVLVSHIPLRL